MDGQEPVEVVRATGERVRKTALAILDQLDTVQVGDGSPAPLDRGAPAPPEATPAATARPVSVEPERHLAASVLVGLGL